MYSPVDNIAKDESPRSMPTAGLLFTGTSISSSHRTDMKYLPLLVFETVTDFCVPISGLWKTVFTHPTLGRYVLDSVNLTLCGYRMVCLSCLDLNLGYPALFWKKLRYAVSRSLSFCCRTWESASLSQGVSCL